MLLRTCQSPQALFRTCHGWHQECLPCSPGWETSDATTGVLCWTPLPPSRLATRTCWTWRQSFHHVGEMRANAARFPPFNAIFMSACRRGGNVVLPLPASKWKDDQWCDWTLQLSLQINPLRESARFCSGIDRLWCSWLTGTVARSSLQSLDFGCALEVELFDPPLGQFDESLGTFPHFSTPKKKQPTHPTPAPGNSPSLQLLVTSRHSVAGCTNSHLGRYRWVHFPVPWPASMHLRSSSWLTNPGKSSSQISNLCTSV